MLSVSNNKMIELDLNDLSTAETHLIKSSLANLCVAVHSCVDSQASLVLKELNRHIYVTPKSYFDMIVSFLSIFSRKKEDMQSKMRKLVKGLDQLQKTQDFVVQMDKKMKEMQPILEQKKIESEELALKIEKDSVEANRVRILIEEEEQTITLKTNEIQKLQEEAEKDLNNALPIIDSALKALESLNPKDISEIRTFSSPPTLVVYTLEAIAILLDSKSDWDSIKRMLNMGFIETLKSFPRDSINSKVLNKLRSKIHSNPNFTPEKVGLQNLASKSLCIWVFAIDNYSRVIKEVQPKKEKLEKMNYVMNESMNTLNLARDRLNKEMVKVKELEHELNRVIDEKEKLGRELSITDTRLQRSSILTGGLKEEHFR